MGQPMTSPGPKPGAKVTLGEKHVFTKVFDEPHKYQGNAHYECSCGWISHRFPNWWGIPGEPNASMVEDARQIRILHLLEQVEATE